VYNLYKHGHTHNNNTVYDRLL